MPATETNNVLLHPEGPDYSFQAGEGTYVLRDDLQLATPPPHPSDPQTTNLNPLATNPNPLTAGVRLSVTIISPRKVVPLLHNVNSTTSGFSDRKTYSIQESEKESRVSADYGSESGSNPSSFAPAFGEGNVALAPATGKKAVKQTKPKSNIVKSNSSFVSRVIAHEGLTKRLSERDGSGLYAFANINRAFQWLDLSTDLKAEPMAKILFTKAHMLCHDVNSMTKSSSHLDVIMGSSAGDIIWYEPMSQKYARINKNGAINNTPVSQIRWIPGSENLFLAAHVDGTLVVYDKEKEDAPFFAEDAILEETNGHVEGKRSMLNVTKSVNSKHQKTNPVACWAVSSQMINQFAFSPDSRHLAVVSEDGCLRIIDYLQERLTDIYSSYYGGLICVCWSPDGKYVLTGGQDDLVSIWSLAEHQIVARCHGHDSWVKAVAFDPWRFDERNYRFGSVGDDCKLLLWDFSVGMLHRPRGAGTRRAGSISTQSISLQRHRNESMTNARLRSNSNITQEEASDGWFVNHPVEPKSRTAQLPPVMSKTIDEHPLCWLGFEQACIITSCEEGHIRMWDRPREGVNGSEITIPVVGSP